MRPNCICTLLIAGLLSWFAGCESMGHHDGKNGMACCAKHDASCKGDCCAHCQGKKGTCCDKHTEMCKGECCDRCAKMNGKCCMRHSESCRGGCCGKCVAVHTCCDKHTSACRGACCGKCPTKV